MANYLGYTNMHYILDDKYKGRKADYFFLMKEGGKDVHRIDKSCVSEGGEAVAPCNVMSGDFHGNGEHHTYWERVDAPILADCKKIDNECIGKYKEEDDEKGYLVDGSVYTPDKGVTVGQDAAPTDSDHMLINDYGSDITINNIVLGKPVDRLNDPKYVELDYYAQGAQQSHEVQFNNATNALIDKDGLLTANIYLSRGKLFLDSWDRYATTRDVSAGRPCSDATTQKKFDIECKICEARAWNARCKIYPEISYIFNCLESDLMIMDGSYCLDGTEVTCEDQSDTCIYETYSWYGHPCDCGSPSFGRDFFACGHGSFYQPYGCGDFGYGGNNPSAWEDDAQGTAQMALERLYNKFNTSDGLEKTLQIYHDDCKNDCDKGTDEFGQNHPNGSSCRDERYSLDGGRKPDLWHKCGASSSEDKHFKIPINKA